VIADDPIALLAAHLPPVFRWAGAIAKQLRRHDIGLGGKSSGFADTDALTLGDLSVQELLVAALRDMGPLITQCRIEAEEVSGDLGRFARESQWTLGIDPIDGTRDYRDRTGNGYSVMLHLRSPDSIAYSLVYLPEEGAEGTWVEARPGRIVVGPDDHARPARVVLDALPPAETVRRPGSRRILVSGFRSGEAERAREVTAAGLEGVLGAETGGSLFPLLARGDLGGALYHTPNVYDFPVCVHLARLLGGDAVWAHDGRPMDFRTVWRDQRSSMLRLPGIVACAVDRQMIAPLVEVARHWNPERYESAPPR
jgi:3'(2'), 5'-bisphosphate nucleotidase